MRASISIARCSDISNSGYVTGHVFLVLKRVKKVRARLNVFVRTAFCGLGRWQNYTSKLHAVYVCSQVRVSYHQNVRDYGVRWYRRGIIRKPRHPEMHQEWLS
ncbi:hypothetical protein ECG_01738 [Echinococcus granulosus]|nr:hypothetical protein ECG_01738 [Echinococcus granulosus]